MRDLSNAERMLHRMVRVRKNAVPIKGTQPIVNDGYWEGTVVEIKPRLVDKRVVDYTLSIKLWAGTSLREPVIPVSFLDTCWGLKFPEKGEKALAI